VRLCVEFHTWRVEAFGGGVGDGMQNIVQKPLQMAAQHFSDSFKLRNATANSASIPEGKELLGRGEIRALPKGVEELPGDPSPSRFELRSYQAGQTGLYTLR
jgi:hypothetical protein